jgi:hypothetical protein
MHGAPPRYLEDEEEAIRLAKKLGWKADARDHALGARKPVSDKEKKEIERFLRARGVDVDEMNRIIQQGGGTIPVGWASKKDKRIKASS